MSIESTKPPDGSPEERLARAEQIADERMTMLYGEALSAWRRSQGEKVVTRHSDRTGETITTTRECCGEPRYLQQALRIAQAQVKLAVRDRKTQEALLAVATPANPHPSGEGSKEPKPEKHKYFTTPFVPLPEDIVVPSGVIEIWDDAPPARDCSPSSTVAVRSETSSPATMSASHDKGRLSVDQRQQRGAFLSGETARKGTVQTAESPKRPR